MMIFLYVARWIALRSVHLVRRTCFEATNGGFVRRKVIPSPNFFFINNEVIRAWNYMGGLWSSGSGSGSDSGGSKGEEREMAIAKAKELVSSNPVMVFSKSYCPYCTRVKQLLSQLGASYKVIELDVESDGSEIQSALAEWTGQRTVPNVFIGGNHIGGCDNVVERHNGGRLVPLLTEAGALASPAA